MEDESPKRSKIFNILKFGNFVIREEVQDIRLDQPQEVIEHVIEERPKKTEQLKILQIRR